MSLCQNFNGIFTPVSQSLLLSVRFFAGVLCACAGPALCYHRKTWCTKGIYIKGLPLNVWFELHIKVLGDLMSNISIIVS